MKVARYYRECIQCGAALDPGEICDCNVEENFKRLTPENQAAAIARIAELLKEQKTAPGATNTQDGTNEITTK